MLLHDESRRDAKFAGRFDSFNGASPRTETTLNNNMSTRKGNLISRSDFQRITDNGDSLIIHSKGKK